MRGILIAIMAGLIGSAGCAHDDTPPPPRASIPPAGTYTDLRGEPAKPLPDQEPPAMPAFADEPIVTQAAPEQPAFVNAYAQVGSPRITLFINRTLAGQIIPTGAVNAQHNAATLDEISAKRIDYDAIETTMTDWLAAGGKVTMVSPTLTKAQVQQLQKGDRNMLQVLEKNNQIDVLIQVQAQPTTQTGNGIGVRLVAEAINTQGGESIGRAIVDIPPPLDKQTINDYTRFLSRKLMSDMTQTWSNPRPQRLTASGPATMP